MIIPQTELKEECQVHSQPEKVSVLEELSNKFLGQSLERSYPHSNARYGLLLFLLSLSNSLINHNYVGVLVR